MAIINASTAAATAVVGYDLLKDQPLAQVPYPRTLRYVALCGSAVIGDCSAELMIGTQSGGIYRNTKLLYASGINTDFIPADVNIPANTRVSLLVRVQPTTSPLNPTLIFTP